MWNPTQYERFKSERAQPFHDLVALIEKRPRMRVADLGCGTGELTRQLHEHLGAAETIGIDSSETMLLKSGAFGGEMLRFERGDIEAFVADRPFDLLFSNAALHWVGEHEALFARLAGFLAPHGQLAVQMPANEDHPSHRIAREVAIEQGHAPRISSVLPVERYAQLLHRLGFTRQHVRTQVYGHLLGESRDVVEWVRGSLLTDYQQRMSEAAFARFLEVYTEKVTAALGNERPFFYTYNRVLIWGTF
jgi:trans-aconitate 2-methyltransferase